MKIKEFMSNLLKSIIEKLKYQNFMNLKEEYKLKPYAVIKEYINNCENCIIINLNIFIDDTFNPELLSH